METHKAREAYHSQVRSAIRHALVDKEWSQNRLSHELGVSGPWLTRRMTGETSWSLDDLLAVAAALDVPFGDLLPRRDSNTEPAGLLIDGYPLDGLVAA